MVPHHFLKGTRLNFLWLLGVLVLSGCASEPPDSRKESVLIDTQDYFIDNGMPIREVKEKQEFFFKKCNVNNRGPYPAKTNYDCNEP
jgi:hypothetical protein